MRCPWFLFAVVAVLATLTSSRGQPPLAPKDGKLVVPLTLSPAPVPVPALKYQLLPELRDLEPGNQIPAFYKCFMEQNNFYRSKEEIARREKWLAAPLADLAGKKDLAGYGGASTRQADYAARLDSVDWAVLARLKVEGINLLLPDVQHMRELATVLKVKLRGEVARKEYGTAIRTAQTMLALARTFDEHPLLIGTLVGVAVEHLALDALEEMAQQPDAPNLFWALVDLPDPLVGLRKGMQGERTWLSKEFDVLRKTAPIPPTELNRLLALLDPIVVISDGEKHERAGNWYARQLADPATLAAAKTRLGKLGFKSDALEKLSPLQLVMMDDYTGYEVARDELMKWTSLPFWRLPTDFDQEKPPPGHFTQVIPAVRKVREAEVRIQQRVAMLQAAEAVRAYAAENGGALPPTLEATKLPVPVDPVTGRPFPYELKDGTAMLRGTPPPARKNEPPFNRVYEITIRK
ncbi:MAG: hypothetical protein JWO38_1525 [Gemmataceae bacterium]|nr:hypothetical protein [Gemmataceae bacterium]